jgi:hypothetical protein
MLPNPSRPARSLLGGPTIVSAQNQQLAIMIFMRMVGDLCHGVRDGTGRLDEHARGAMVPWNPRGLAPPVRGIAPTLS